METKTIRIPKELQCPKCDSIFPFHEWIDNICPNCGYKQYSERKVRTMKVIKVSPDTIYRLKQLGTMRDTYDTVINMLIDEYYKHIGGNKAGE